MGAVAEPRELPRVADRADDRAVRAFEAVYLECRLPVYRYLRTLTRSDDTATELTAATFERAIESANRLDRNRPALPWLLRIARNIAIDANRRNRPMLHLDELDTSAGTFASTLPEEAALVAERDSELRALVAALPEPQRHAIALRFAAGLTARDIGAVIGKSEEATQKLLSRALDALREAHDANR